MPKAPSILKLCKDPAKATVGKFYEFKNATDTSVDLYFYGDIVSDWWGAWQEEDQYPEAIKNFLAEAGGKDLNIYINSGGGSVFAGIAIYNMLKRYTGKKTVCVDALAGSIASVIAFADSDMPTIPSNAYLMIHKPWAVCDGNATELRKMADTLDAVESGIWAIYEEHLAEGVTIDDKRTYGSGNLVKWHPGRPVFPGKGRRGKHHSRSRPGLHKVLLPQCTAKTSFRGKPRRAAGPGEAEQNY